MRLGNLAIICLTTLLSACTTSGNQFPAQPTNSTKPALDEPFADGVRTLKNGSNIQISPNVELEAGPYQPVVILGAKDSPSRTTIEVGNEITVWDAGTQTRIEVLGKNVGDTDVADLSYAVKFKSTTAAKLYPPSKAAKGSYIWDNGAPIVSFEDINYTTISTNPLLIVGAASADRMRVLTNFGHLDIGVDAQSKKPTGVRADSSFKTSIGPAEVTLAREYTIAKNSNQVAIVISDFDKYTGPIVVDYKLPFYPATSTRSIKAYVPPSATPLPPVQRYEKSDTNFPLNWNLVLDPPILLKRGGPRGGTTGPVEFKCTLWRFDERLYGAFNASYGDHTSRGGGLLGGTLKDNAVTLKLTGKPNILMKSKSMTSTLISGTAKVSGEIPEDPNPKQLSAPRTFKLEAAKAEPNGQTLPFCYAIANADAGKLVRQIESIPPNTPYWNALAATPGDSGNSEVVSHTLKLVQLEADRKAGKTDDDHVNNEVLGLADSHFGAWRSAVYHRGINHPISIAHEQIAEDLYKRLLTSTEGKTRTASRHKAMESLAKMLRETNRPKDAEAVEKKMAEEK